MSNVERRCEASLSSDCPPPAGEPIAQRVETANALLGEGMTIRRALPRKARRMIGAWCFLDHFGPVDVSTGDGLRVGPHPHIGLQTVTWPLAGEILHRDSLGYAQHIRPRQLNLMTAGRGIVHSEESPRERPPGLHGAQLWIALPEGQRRCEPAFDHHSALPTLERDGVDVTVLIGEAFGVRSPARIFSPMMGADLEIPAGADARLPLRTDFEYGALVLEGQASVEHEAIGVGTLLYLDRGRSALSIVSREGARLLLLGGEPFAETILLWWNFVARTREEMAEARSRWLAGGFGEVEGYDGSPLTIPELPWR